MGTETLTLYNQNFESIGAGVDMSTEGFTHNQYLTDVSTFATIAGVYGECKVTSGAWGGSHELDGSGSFENETIEFDVVSHSSGRIVFGFDIGTHGYFYQNVVGALNESRILTAAKAYPASAGLADAENSPATLTHVKIVLSTGNIKIYLNNSSTPTNDFDDTTYSSGKIAISAFLGGWVINNLQVYKTVTVSNTNNGYIKRNLLRLNSDITIEVNKGETLDTAQNINEYVVNMSDVKEKLTKSSTSTGGVVLPSLKLKLDNSKGEWNIKGKKFANGFLNNSLVTITTNYLDDYDVAITPAFVYKGVMKYSSSSWDRNRFLFETTLIPASSTLTSEKIQSGILSNNTFKNIIYKILNRQPFTKYMTINLANITMGWDVSATDSVANMVDKKVKSVLDEIMLITGSVYYVNYDQEFIVEPIAETSPSADATLRGHDIINVSAEDYYWKGQYTSIVWDDDTNTIQRKEISYTDRALYQYDYVELKLTNKYVTNTTNRTTILNNLLNQYKFLKRKVKIKCKWNPEIKINKYISLDVPEEAIKDDNNFIWNETQWNDSKFWGLAQPGISFSSVALWRVVELSRKPLGEQMTLVLVQANSDDEN